MESFFWNQSKVEGAKGESKLIHASWTYPVKWSSLPKKAEVKGLCLNARKSLMKIVNAIAYQNQKNTLKNNVIGIEKKWIENDYEKFKMIWYVWHSYSETLLQ